MTLKTKLPEGARLPKFFPKLIDKNIFYFDTWKDGFKERLIRFYGFDEASAESYFNEVREALAGKRKTDGMPSMFFPEDDEEGIWYGRVAAALPSDPAMDLIGEIEIEP
jgi:hypothetical protein